MPDPRGAPDPARLKRPRHGWPASHRPKPRTGALRSVQGSCVEVPSTGKEVRSHTARPADRRPGCAGQPAGSPGNAGPTPPTSRVFDGQHTSGSPCHDVGQPAPGRYSARRELSHELSPGHRRNATAPSSVEFPSQARLRLARNPTGVFGPSEFMSGSSKRRQEVRSHTARPADRRPGCAGQPAHSPGNDGPTPAPASRVFDGAARAGRHEYGAGEWRSTAARSPMRAASLQTIRSGPLAMISTRGNHRRPPNLIRRGLAGSDPGTGHARRRTHLDRGRIIVAGRPRTRAAVRTPSPSALPISGPASPRPKPNRSSSVRQSS